MYAIPVYVVVCKIYFDLGHINLITVLIVIWKGGEGGFIWNIQFMPKSKREILSQLNYGQYFISNFEIKLRGMEYEYAHQN